MRTTRACPSVMIRRRQKTFMITTEGPCPRPTAAGRSPRSSTTLPGPWGAGGRRDQRRATMELDERDKGLEPSQLLADTEKV